MVQCFCFAFGRISWVKFIMSCSNQLKPSQQIAINYNWCVWAEHWRKNGCYTSRDTIKGYCNMTMLGYMLQNGSKPTWKHLNEKSYFIHHIHQTLPNLIITSSNWWHIAWWNSTFIFMKMLKIGSTYGKPQKTYYFSNVELKCCQKDEKNCG